MYSRLLLFIAICLTISNVLGYNEPLTEVIFIGTGSGTDDISYILPSKSVESVIGNAELLQFEPVFSEKKYVMGFRSTLFISSNAQNGYLSVDDNGDIMLQNLLQLIPLEETVISHIKDRIKDKRTNGIYNKVIKRYAVSNCTAPIIGPDYWTGIDYNVQKDDCGFFTGQHQGDNNCYAYSTDIATNTFPQPGRGSGQKWSFNTCPDMINAAERDGLTYIGMDIADLHVGPTNGHYVALYIWPNTNFHWARMDYNGTYHHNINNESIPRRWSHKPGGTEVQIVDNNGDCIGDIAPCVLPSKADLSPWSVFCGYMTAIPDQLTIE
eukprot:270716_1